MPRSRRRKKRRGSGIVGRQAFAERGLVDLRARLANDAFLRRFRNICVYATGSYGRLEAGAHSDLDAFIIQVREGRRLLSAAHRRAIARRVKKILAASNLQYTDRFLKVQSETGMLLELGGQKDDIENHFTARMLLLLESRWLFSDENHTRLVRSVVNAYFRDYHDHTQDFTPVFLVNDIVRYWKTLCLNYEHKRNRPDSNPRRKSEQHVKNLKLKFSRLLTCYSMIVAVSAIARQRTVNPDAVLELVELTPLQRLSLAGRFSRRASRLNSALRADYDWFLRAAGRSEDEMVAWIDSRRVRNNAFAIARRFGDNLLKLFLEVADGRILRYTLV